MWFFKSFWCGLFESRWLRHWKILTTLQNWFREKNLSEFPLKRFILFWFEGFCERRQKFSQVYGMKNTTVSSIKWLNYEFYIKWSTQTFELNLKNDIRWKSPSHKFFYRSVNHPFFRNFPLWKLFENLRAYSSKILLHQGSIWPTKFKDCHFNSLTLLQILLSA